VLQTLVVILGKKTQIDADEAMVHMAYNIIKAHICYEFLTFISNEIKRCIFKIKKSNFRNSSYLWWLLAHQNLDKLMEVGLPIQLANPSTRSIPIDLRVLFLSKLHGSYYEFIDKLYAIIMHILIGRLPSRPHKSTFQELQGESNICDWYFLKDRTMIMRYGYFENPFQNM